MTSGYGVGGDLFKVTPAGGEFTVEQVYPDELDIRIRRRRAGGEHLYGTADRI